MTFYDHRDGTDKKRGDTSGERLIEDKWKKTIWLSKLVFNTLYHGKTI
jgi:hypothetical protein